ncbi:acetyl-CoA acetyltransferase, cytosolic [Chrysoperla carnea]|uniref:acetyl-CoA acetyltransferase, cytosolic n=1 Tax=Chrysoperla carnea TaxID=189513 RepID=UPI001D068EAC|nr:acetyl-CoA acetyltransferase, cytosolic [Chrysoperla carnea]
MTDVVIVSACRTPIGNFGGAFSGVRAHELGAVVIKEVINRAGVPAQDVSEVIVGQTLTAGQGQNTARQAVLKAGFPIETPAYCVNMLCGSGLKSVILGYQAIKSGEGNIIVSVGQESMTMSQHTILLRTGIKLGQGTLTDSLLEDGLTDAFHGVHMGVTAEEVAKKYNISRADQDELAVESQRRTKLSYEKKLFSKEIVPVEVPDKKNKIIVTNDEFPKPDTTLEGLAKLKPIFKTDGTVTPGNASGINDGASAVCLMSLQEAERRNIKPLARIVAVAQTGIEPLVMGLGPITAVNLVLKKANWSKDDVDLYELNEAFAAQAIAVQRELGVSPEKINVNGGAISLGHPIGASGNRVLVTLLYALEQRNAKKGVASLCIGGGMGIAIAVERL